MNTIRFWGVVGGLAVTLCGCGADDDAFGDGVEGGEGGTTAGSSSTTAGAGGQSTTSSSDSSGTTATGTGGASGGQGPGGAAPSYEVSGRAVRTVEINSPADGLGTLCVAVTDGCPSLSLEEPTGFAGAQIDNADLSGPGAQVQFTIDASGLADGTYVVTGFLQEAGGACGTEPTQGDPVAFDFGTGNTPCPSFDVSGGVPVGATGLVLTFNFAMPF
ncbi:MAG: hypothetical protein JRI23_32970 [Deltaproteobacteria bacterium]|jgi:hypothetical protein|nr:hypothetical protein [Deltaproteobacteria bacterium]MBW2537066.1 hypothetical protein [Deltaproteobacteria bacterium]